MKKRLAVFVSGTGSNLSIMIEAIEKNIIQNIEINCVIADRECPAIQKTLSKNIPTFIFPRKHINYKYINILLTNEQTDFILLAGFLSILSPDFCFRWKKKIINIHPSLLPKYGGKGMYGKNVFRAIIQNQEKESGITFHFVNEVIDGGEIIFQTSFPLDKKETIDSLKKKTQNLEHKHIVEVVGKL